MPVFNLGLPIETPTPTIEVTNSTAVPLAPGEYTFQLEVVDNDGLVSAPAAISVLVREALITVPNVVNLPQANAQAVVQQAGLVFVVAGTQQSSGLVGRVLSQSPAGGTIVAPDTVVSVILSTIQISTLIGAAGPEPDTLFWPATNMLSAGHILEALYDGPYDDPPNPTNPKHLPVILAEPPQISTQVVVAGRNVPRVSAGALLTSGPQVRLDQLTAVFTLRDDLRWQDGTSVTSRDIVFAFELIRQAAMPISKFRTRRTAVFEALDDLTIQWQGLPGWVDPHPLMNLPTPLPAHLLDGLSIPEILEVFAREPVSYGPYVLGEWQPGDVISLQEHPFYFRAAEGLPRIKEIQIPLFTDSAQITAGLAAGELDFALSGSLSFTDLAQLQDLATAGELEVLLEPGHVQEYLFFNYDNPGLEFIHDPRIRQAIAFALDRQFMVDELWRSNAALATSYLAPSHPFFFSDLPSYPFNPDQALELLMEVGFSGGLNASITLLVPAGRDDRLKMAEIIRENLLLLGIDLIITPVAPRQLFRKGPRTPIFGRLFEMALFSWTADFATAAHLFLCEEISNEGNGFGGRNFCGYCDKTYDVSTLAALATNDRGQWFESQQVWAEQLPAIPLFHPFKLAVKRPFLQPFKLLPLQPSELTPVEEMTL